MPAAASRMQMRTRCRVMPCAFQWVSAHAKVKGNCSRVIASSDCEVTGAALKTGTQRSRPSSEKKRLPGGNFTSSNSTITQSGVHRLVSSEFGSKFARNMKPRTTPAAPFTRPASTHSLVVSNTRAPGHKRSSAFKPRNWSSSMRSGLVPFGRACRARTERIGRPLSRERRSKRPSLYTSAPSWPCMLVFLPSMRSGASLNSRSYVALPSSVESTARLLRLARNCQSARVHSRSAIRRVTSKKVCAPCR